MKMDIKEEKMIMWAEAKKILETKEKEGELGYEQKNALEHLRKFSKLSDKKSKDLFEELGKKIERLKDRQKINIVNMLPHDMNDLKVLFANEVISISDEDKKKILSIVKKFT
jgi:DNA-directed RNA polymerase subunit F